MQLTGQRSLMLHSHPGLWYFQTGTLLVWHLAQQLMDTNRAWVPCYYHKHNLHQQECYQLWDQWCLNISLTDCWSAIHSFNMDVTVWICMELNLIFIPTKIVTITCSFSVFGFLLCFTLKRPLVHVQGTQGGSVSQLFFCCVWIWTTETNNSTFMQTRFFFFIRRELKNG